MPSSFPLSTSFSSIKSDELSVKTYFRFVAAENETETVCGNTNDVLGQHKKSQNRFKTTTDRYIVVIIKER